MGLTTRRNENDIVDPGDALITYEGQRFLPGDSIWDPTGGCEESQLEARWEPPRDAAAVGAAHVSERVWKKGDRFIFLDLSAVGLVFRARSVVLESPRLDPRSVDCPSIAPLQRFAYQLPFANGDRTVYEISVCQRPFRLCGSQSFVTRVDVYPGKSPSVSSVSVIMS